MDKDRIEGKMKDVKGRVERQVGEWTGDEKTRAKGAADQLKGKAQNAVGKVKDASRDAIDKLKDNADAEDREARRKTEDDAA
jgi:uncharacterized protein YjbJ (UPF0337 family)